MSWPRKLAIAAGVLLALLLLLTGVFTLAYNRELYVPQSGPAPDLVLRGGLLFDGTGDAPVPNSLLVVRAGRIACIGETCTVPDGAVTIDAGNRAILPGLIDLHGHFSDFVARPVLPKYGAACACGRNFAARCWNRA